MSGCNVTLWPRVRFQHRFNAGPCFFRLPNRPSNAQQHWWIEIAFSSFQMGRSVFNQTCPTGHLKVKQINFQNNQLWMIVNYVVIASVCRRNGVIGRRKLFRNVLRPIERRFANLFDTFKEFDTLRPSSQ